MVVRFLVLSLGDGATVDRMTSMFASDIPDRRRNFLAASSESLLSSACTGPSSELSPAAPPRAVLKSDSNKCCKTKQNRRIR